MSLVGSSVATYGGVYRARCLEMLTDRARVVVPQIFSDVVIAVFDFAGPRPDPGDDGWVVFESGLAEHPIWTGSESKGGGAVTVEGIPPGGTAGQVLTKESGDDYDTEWTTVSVVAPAATSYHHHQAVAATSWVITHNLNFYPNVSVVDSSGREVVPGAVDYTSTTVVTLTFSAAIGGEAFLS